ncbi:MAG: ABC transporter ATP-binding protein [Gammaproteobacteria bacterium]
MSAAQSSPLLELVDLGVVLGGRHVLDVSHVRVERGQVVLLTGDNGAGKTTLLKTMAGLLRAGRGTFNCLGTVMPPRRAQRFCRGRHVYLHQTPYMFDGTVRDNIAYGLRRRGRDLAQQAVEIEDALDWAGLEHLAARPARRLSTGEKQRVALTRAKILNPPLLLLDEITANMDANSRQRTCELVADLKRAGASVIFATHDRDAIGTLADVELELAAGRVVAGEPPRASVLPLRPGRVERD